MTRAQTKRYRANLSNSVLCADQLTDFETAHATSPIFLLDKEELSTPSAKALALQFTRDKFIETQKNEKTHRICLSSVPSKEESKGKKVASTVFSEVLKTS